MSLFSFRQNTLSTERRRRLLPVEQSAANVITSGLDWPSENGPPQKSEHYGDAEFLNHQLRWLDLVPRSWWAVWLWPLVGAAIITLLEFAYTTLLGPGDDSDGKILATFDIAAKGSLACWFSSLMLFVAAIAALMIYSVRRHRLDDYQGRYRIWLWAAALWLLLATDQAAALRDAFRELMTALSGTSLWAEGDAWWIAAYTLLFGAIGSRLLIDMRRSLSSVTVLLAAVVAHALAVAGHLGWNFSNPGKEAVMFQAGSEMAGNLLLLSSMVFYARYVVLDAEGRLPVRHRVATESLATAVALAGAESWRRHDPPQPLPQPAHQRLSTSTTPFTPSAAQSTTSVASTSVGHKLTKAEKKALKERLLRERLERQQRLTQF